MQRIVRVVFVTAVPIAVAFLMPPAPAAQEPVPASAVPFELRATHESVSPGGIVQVKVGITEPKPISTGRGRFEFDAFERVDGIGLSSPAGDAYGVAVVSGGGMTISFVSPSGTLAADSDYPLLTVTGRVPDSAPMGVRFPFQINGAAIHLVDASGAVVPIVVEDGSVVTAPAVSIGNVTPGSGTLPAGTVVTITGRGFDPETRVRLDQTQLDDVRFVDSSRVDVVLSEPAVMQGRRIRAIDKNSGFKNENEYFSYQRTSREGISRNKMLALVYPVFPESAAQERIIDLTDTAIGLALQNPGASAVTVTAELLAEDGSTLSAIVIPLAGRTYIVREPLEIFEQPTVKAAAVRLLAGAPIQAMGIAIDESGAATPVIPR